MFSSASQVIQMCPWQRAPCLQRRSRWRWLVSSACERSWCAESPSWGSCELLSYQFRRRVAALEWVTRFGLVAMTVDSLIMTHYKRLLSVSLWHKLAVLRLFDTERSTPFVHWLFTELDVPIAAEWVTKMNSLAPHQHQLQGLWISVLDDILYLFPMSNPSLPLSQERCSVGGETTWILINSNNNISIEYQSVAVVDN